MKPKKPLRKISRSPMRILRKKAWDLQSKVIRQEERQKWVEEIEKGLEDLIIDGRVWTYQHQGLVNSQNKKIEALKQKINPNREKIR